MYVRKSKTRRDGSPMWFVVFESEDEKDFCLQKILCQLEILYPISDTIPEDSENKEIYIKTKETRERTEDFITKIFKRCKAYKDEFSMCVYVDEINEFLFQFFYIGAMSGQELKIYKDAIDEYAEAIDEWVKHDEKMRLLADNLHSNAEYYKDLYEKYKDLYEKYEDSCEKYKDLSQANMCLYVREKKDFELYQENVVSWLSLSKEEKHIAIGRAYEQARVFAVHWLLREVKENTEEKWGKWDDKTTKSWMKRQIRNYYNGLEEMDSSCCSKNTETIAKRINCSQFLISALADEMIKSAQRIKEENPTYPKNITPSKASDENIQELIQLIVDYSIDFNGCMYYDDLLEQLNCSPSLFEKCKKLANNNADKIIEMNGLVEIQSLDC